MRFPFGSVFIFLAVAQGALLLASEARAEPVLCGNLWYPGGVCPPPPAPTPPPPPRGSEPAPPQGPTPEQIDAIHHERFVRAEDAGIRAYRRGDYQSAIAAFEEALANRPDNPVIKHDIERARERLAEQNGPAVAPGSSHAFNQLNAVANSSRSAVQAPSSSYSADLGGTGGPERARTGFDTPAPAASIPFAFARYLEAGADPVIPANRRTPAINALEKQRDLARTTATNLEMRRIASSVPTASREQKRKQPAIAAQEKVELNKVKLLDFSITKALSGK